MNTHWLLVGCGGFAGAISRYLFGTFVQGVSRTHLFPVGTLVVNVIGCLLIGFLMGLPVLHKSMDSELRLLLVTGFLGGFTTFSAFGHETMQLLLHGAEVRAGFYVLASVGLGLAAVRLGQLLAGRWL